MSIVEMDVIARHRRDRKSNTLPLMNTDSTDLLRSEKLYRGLTRMVADKQTAEVGWHENG